MSEIKLGWRAAVSRNVYPTQHNAQWEPVAIVPLVPGAKNIVQLNAEGPNPPQYTNDNKTFDLREGGDNTERRGSQSTGSTDVTEGESDEARIGTGPPQGAEGASGSPDVLEHVEVICKDLARDGKYAWAQAFHDLAAEVRRLRELAELHDAALAADDGEPDITWHDLVHAVRYPEPECETCGDSQKCPDAQLPDGEACPRCGGKRAPSGVDRGSWVHFPEVPCPDCTDERRGERRKNWPHAVHVDDRRSLARRSKPSRGRSERA